jgi:hypothetical protein
MGYSLPENAEWAEQRLKILGDEGKELLAFTLEGDLDVLEAYQDKIHRWAESIQGILQTVYPDPSIQSIDFLPIEKLELEKEMRKVAVEKLKAQVSRILDGVRDLPAK